MTIADEIERALAVERAMFFTPSVGKSRQVSQSDIDKRRKAAKQARQQRKRNR